jgi:polysaccharide export outer membrane protein
MSLRPRLSCSGRLLVLAAALAATLCLPADSRAQAPAAAAGPSVAGQATSAPIAQPSSTVTQDQIVSNPLGPDAATDAARAAALARRDASDRRPAPPTATQPETQFQQLVQATTGQYLPIFGAQLFSSVPSTFAPVTDVPVAPNYLIGPGDELVLQLSGQVNQQFRVTVDRTGAISIPGLAPIHVAGTSFADLPALLNRELGIIYRNYSLSVNLGSLRTIQVFVTGQAARPGSYTISSLSTLLNAIFASGGPLPQGSLRDIQVNRSGRTIDHFDLYGLLLHGDKSRDIPLVSGDVIFIPVVGPQVAVTGSVNNPAIYELKGETSVAAALQLAGGQTAVAAGSSVRLERVYERSMRSIEDVALDAGNTNPLHNGDIISVSSVLERFRDAVTLRGNVANPGRYVWHPGMHLSDLIPNKESLITRDYWRKRNALGQTAPDYQPGTGNSIQSEGSLQLHGNQADQTASNAETGNASSSMSSGNSVGTALTTSNNPFGPRTDVVLSAPDIDWSYAVIERQSTQNLTTSLIPFNLGKLVMEGDPSQNLELLPGDVVTIFSKADIRVPITQQTRFVRLEGEFNAAGVYSVLPGETLRGLLQRVGGFTPQAYLYASEFSRESTRRVEQQRLHEYADQLDAQIAAASATSQANALSPTDQQAAAASETAARTAVNRIRNIQPVGRIVLDLRPDSQGVDAVPDIPLEDGDRFVVPSIPTSVTVEGQVYNANAFIYQPHQNTLNYLHRAGGPDRQADRKRTFILRADGSVVSRQYANVERSILYPGDTIIVPPIIDRRATFQHVISIAQLLGNLGLSAATFDILLHQ